jgi:hypothetical protein
VPAHNLPKPLRANRLFACSRRNALSEAFRVWRDPLVTARERQEEVPLLAFEHPKPADETDDALLYATGFTATEARVDADTDRIARHAGQPARAVKACEREA